MAGRFSEATFPTIPLPSSTSRFLLYSLLMLWVALTWSLPSSSMSMSEQILDSMTSAVTVTIRRRMSSRYFSDVMARLTASRAPITPSAELPMPGWACSLSFFVSFLGLKDRQPLAGTVITARPVLVCFFLPHSGLEMQR